MTDISPASALTHYSQKRPWGHFVALLAILLLVAASFFAADWDVTSLTEAQKRAQALGRMTLWLGAFSSPELSGEFLKHSWELTLQTLSAAILGTAIAVVLGFLLAIGSARSVCVGEENAVSWRRNFPLRSPSAVLCSACRLLQDVLRAVPDFIWAIILVALIGLGPLTGALALALNITGILAKVYSELWDSIDEREYEQVRVLGAGRLKTFLYGIRPLAARSVLSFTLMRAECAIRNAAVIGAVGGGGLGAEIWYQVRFGAWDKVSTLILFTLFLTLTVDLVSNSIRRQLRNDPNHPQAVKSRSTFATLSRAYVSAAVILIAFTWSFWFMGWGNNAAPGGESRNYLKPAAELVSGDSWGNLRFFQRLLHPDLDLAVLGRGDTEAAAQFRAGGKAVSLFDNYGPLEFYRPAAWVAWEGELQKWFVWRVIKSSTVPLAIAVVGTLLGMLGAILLTYPHTLAFQLEPDQFTGETSHPLIRLLRFIHMTAARIVGLIARGVPEVMWAFLFIAFFGPGLVAGTIAISIHSMGVLVRVFSETVDNIPYRRFEQSFMGSRMACFGSVAAPISWRDWMTYTFFQFESNVRAAVVLGIVGVGGLGFFFTFNFEWFRFEKAGTYLLMMVALTITIDRISRMLKLSRVRR
ncbi:PhnE/PtxC family ABC transporter permease [Pelovirga terrestris]|uniref:ABC transporter permease subunit n=1 Tax=Pelovirga terrestris TaxID=2771352 RepID=A0A8J6UR90_9BACT|nr:ABC transporter permease subunit [Pelovirga terrestris]MBD1400861.1 ABC transporter permease subunit [Pelovirga terrestris]